MPLSVQRACRTCLKMQTMSRKLTFAVLAIASCVGLLAIAIFVGHNAGREDAKLAIQRLDLVFGNVMTLPEADRLLLVKLSMTCRLSSRPLARDETIRCLREATSAPSLQLPADLPDPQTHLDKLLNSVPKPVEAISQYRV
jgi:hypothetical protein